MTSHQGTPAIQADLLGDWREELAWPSSDSTELRIYTTAAGTDVRLRTLIHDPVYRQSVARENIAYNQPPHPSFYIGGRHGTARAAGHHLHRREVTTGRKA